MQTQVAPARFGSLILGGAVAIALCWAAPSIAQDATGSQPTTSGNANGGAGTTSPTTTTSANGDGTNTTTTSSGTTAAGGTTSAGSTSRRTRPAPSSPAAGGESAGSANEGAANPDSAGADRYEIISPEIPPKGPAAGPDNVKVDLNFVDLDLLDLLKRFADWKRMNFIITDKKELEGKSVSIISHHKVTIREAYEAFQSALAMHGLTIVETNGMGRIVKSGDASKSPIKVGKGTPGRTDVITTQLIQLENVSVSDVSKVIQGLVSPEAQVTAYQPTNTMIITDTGNNLRKVYEVLRELDVAAPKSSMKIVPLAFADSAEVKAIIEQLYPSAATDSGSSSRGTTSRSTRSSTSRSSSRTNSRSSRSSSRSTSSAEANAVGESSNYISKVLDDERTNSLIVLANDDGHKAVADLVAKLDVDVDPQNRAQIHVVNLEHAKAEEVAQVLSELSQAGNNQNSRRGAAASRAATRSSSSNAAAALAGGAGGEEGEARGAIAAFDSGMRIAADENTNSLVIIANQEDYRVVKSVIDELDIVRRQVFVDAVVLEINSEDTIDMGLAAHMPTSPAQDSVGFVGGQFNATSLGFNPTTLSGLAAGVFGQTVDVPVADPTGGVTSIGVPAFGIVLNALKTNSSVNIISSPNLLTLDNEEAKIVVGRKVPFPTQAGLSNLGQPVISFQREDVAITLEVTPRINSADFVTLEVKVEVSEIEEDDSGLEVGQSGGPITSKREVETVALVQDNQTVVLGGLVGSTETEVETKFPVLGDIPLIGSLFRGSRKSSRKTNLMVFLTPHIVDDEDDMWEIQRVKEAQRQEFLRRFYGRSREAYTEEMRKLLRYSMNYVDQPSMFRGPTSVATDLVLDGEPLSDESRSAIEGVMNEATIRDPGAGAGELPEGELIIEGDPLPEDPAIPPVQSEGSTESDGEEM